MSPWSGMGDKPRQTHGWNLPSVAEVKDAARRRRQAAAAQLQASIRALERELLWSTAACPELLGLKESLEAARDELCRRIDTKAQARLDEEAQREKAVKMDACYMHALHHANAKQLLRDEARAEVQGIMAALNAEREEAQADAKS